MKHLFNRYFHLIFIGLFFTLSGYLLSVPPIWDEWVYLQLAASPFDQSQSLLSWVPHPPLLWCLLAIFSPAPRIAILFPSTLCICFLFYVCRRLYGNEVANLSVVVLISNWLYMLLSLVMFTDGPVAAFMTLSVLSFLCWEKLEDQKFLWLNGVGLALASMTKYTAVPILLLTFIVWLIVLRRSFNWFKVFKLFGVTVVSLLPLGVWIYSLSKLYGNIAFHYSLVNNLFPEGLLSTLTANLIYYAPWLLLLWGLPLISWNRRRLFDLDSKLLLIYLAVIFFFFMPINVRQFRYFLPMIPAMTVISARSLVKEKVSTRFLILCPQFLFASLISLVALLLRLV